MTSWLIEKVIINDQTTDENIKQLLTTQSNKEYLFGCLSIDNQIIDSSEKYRSAIANSSSSSSVVTDFSILQVVDGGSLGTELGIMSWGSSFQLQDNRYPELSLIPQMGHSSGLKLNPELINDFQSVLENTKGILTGGSWIQFNPISRKIEKYYHSADGLVYFMILSKIKSSNRDLKEEDFTHIKKSRQNRKKNRKSGPTKRRFICSGGTCRLIKKPKVLAGNKKYKIK